MEWNFKINGKRVRWQISDTVAVFPSPEIAPPFSLEALTQGGDDDLTDAANALPREERARYTFERAGWQFVESLPPPDNTGGPGDTPLPGDETARPVFISENNELFVGTDVATVQLNAAATTSEATAKAVLAQDGLTLLHKLSFAPHLYAVRLPSNRSLPDVIDQLQAKTDRYVFAEPSCLQRISGRETPGDPRFADQWQHASEPDPSGSGTGGFGLHSIPAWDLATGAGVNIAIIDTGMDIAHVDLAGAIAGGGFFRPDGPGTGTATFVRFQPGMNGFPMRGHGTLCLGMAGARRNNGNGGCGVAPDSQLIAIACALNQTGNQLTLARSIEYALDPKQVDPEDLTPAADIISCSLEIKNHVETVLEMAINSATSGRGGLGVPIFWAVSNDPDPISEDPVCSLANVIAVGASTRNGDPDVCATGPKLEFLAPGVDVIGPSFGTNNILQSGTSFATPLAAGVAALVMSVHRDWTAQQVLQRLRDTCDLPPNGDANLFGHGRLNAHRAVQ
jgi:thermitase